MSATPAILRGCRMTMVMRARLDRGGSLHVDKVVEFPRLTRHRGRKTWRHPVETTWCVDGQPVADLDEAVRLLFRSPAHGPIAELSL
jgi:hypothetical protein